MQSANSPDYTPDNSAEIVIIGSGLAGLAAGQLLLECGHKALILIKAAVWVGACQHGGQKGFYSIMEPSL